MLSTILRASVRGIRLGSRLLSGRRLRCNFILRLRIGTKRADLLSKLRPKDACPALFPLQLISTSCERRQLGITRYGSEGLFMFINPADGLSKGFDLLL